MRLMPPMLVLAVLAWWPTALQAQSFSIHWFTLDGGGGTSAGGSYSIHGTIGQPDAGMMSGGPSTLTGGFWALPVLVQSTHAPTLYITNVSPGFATIGWTPPTPGFVLQSTDTLTPPNWVNSPGGAGNPTTVPATLPTRFTGCTNLEVAHSHA